MKTFFNAVTFMAGITIALGSFAAEWTIDIEGTPEFGYNDNVTLRENKEDSFTFKIKPTLVLGRAVDDMTSSVQLGYALERYSSISRLDSENPFILFRNNYSTERANFGLNASFVEDSTRNEAEDDNGDFASSATSRTRSISPSISYQVTEIDSIQSNFTYSEKEYSSPDFDDNQTKSLTLGWTRQFTERFTAGVNTTVSNYKIDGLTSSSDDDNYNLATFLSYQLTETWSISGDIGFRRLETERKFNTGNVLKDTNSGSSFSISSAYAQEKDDIDVKYYKELSPSSSGNVNEQEGISLNWSRELTELITANLRASYKETRTASSQLDDEKRENINLSPSLTWKLDSNLGLNIGYVFKQQKRDEMRDVESNSVMVSVTYDWDGYRISR